MRMDDGVGLAPHAGASTETGAVSGAILERLDSIGRLLAEGAAGPRRAVPGSNLANRIDMLGRIVEQVLADREADEARVTALVRRIVALEAGLAPALAACTERLDAALPILAGPALEREPGAPALALLLSDLRERLDRMMPPEAPDSAPRGHGRPQRPGTPAARAAGPRTFAAPAADGPAEAAEAPTSAAADDGAPIAAAPLAGYGPDDTLRRALQALGVEAPPG